MITLQHTPQYAMRLIPGCRVAGLGDAEPGGRAVALGTLRSGSHEMACRRASSPRCVIVAVRLYSRAAGTAANLFVVTRQRTVVTAAEMDRMSPQARADAIDASVVRDWNRVPPTLRREIVATAHRLDAERLADADRPVRFTESARFRPRRNEVGVVEGGGSSRLRCRRGAQPGD